MGLRRDVQVRDVLLAWAIGLASLVALLVALVGCATPAYPTESGGFSTVEMALVDNVARFSAQLGVPVKGAITTERYRGTWLDGTEWEATGWYTGGVAYFNRDMVEKFVRLVPTPGCVTATDAAAHEVAHSLYYPHDEQHWCCTVHMGATPTYPAPMNGLVCDGVAARCQR